MRRTGPLQRRTRLARKTRLRARGKSKYAKRPRAKAYMAWVRRQGCLLRESRFVMEAWLLHALTIQHVCYGRVEADHAGERVGAFRKGPDRDVIPLCKRAHQERTDMAGTFRMFDAREMRAFRKFAVAYVHDLARDAGVTVPDV